MSLLGIIGGMGAPAGIRFARYIIEECKSKGASKDTDFPRFILYNAPCEAMNEKGIATERLPLLKFHLIESVDKMSESGCTHLLIACNTAHSLISELRTQFSGIIFDIVEIACHQVSDSCQHVGVVSSDATRHGGIYAKQLRSRHKNTVQPNDSEQRVIDAAILEAVSDRQTRNTGIAVGGVLDSLVARGAQEIIVGCTELPMVIDWSHAPVRLIDPGRAAVHAALAIL